MIRIRVLLFLLVSVLIAGACSKSEPKLETDEDRYGRDLPKLFVDPVPHNLDEHNDRLKRLDLAPAISEAPFPYAQTFQLHSLPGANRVIYLDFDGEQISGKGWNDSAHSAPFFATGFDSDGNPAVFSNTEQDVIQGIWQRVAEDYTPFSVDVTTQDPGQANIDRTDPSDTNFGTRALITNTTSIFDTCNCGGLAWVGVFDEATSHEFYQPALIFQKALGAVEKNLAEAVSHEVGHSLGLSHDGSGADPYFGGSGVWAPIMGVGYYRPVTTFSKGEYPNPTNTENDFSVIQSNGLSLRADDHVNTIAGATPLGAGYSGFGVISTPEDVDMFSLITSGGQLALTVNPAPRAPNLDARLEVLDPTGAVLVSADPPSNQPFSANPDSVAGLAASVTTTLTNGTFYVRVQGVAGSNYSDYGSLGAYTLNASIPQALPSFIIGDISKLEGSGGGVSYMSFPITLSAPSSTTVTVIFKTNNGTALAGSDYTAKTVSVSFAPGVTKKFVRVTVRADNAKELAESFTVTLSSPTGATINDGVATGTIRNDD